MPLPTDVYSNLVRLFYSNLKVRTLDNVEFTIDSRVREKNKIITPRMLSKIIGVPMIGVLGIVKFFIIRL